MKITKRIQEALKTEFMLCMEDLPVEEYASLQENGLIGKELDDVQIVCKRCGSDKYVQRSIIEDNDEIPIELDVNCTKCMKSVKLDLSSVTI